MAVLFAQWVYDPLQLFHKSFFHDGIYISGNMRESARVIIDRYDFDSVISGSSMLENTSAKEAEKIFGGKFMNLSITGGNPADRAVILRYLLRKKKIKRVIYSVDFSFIPKKPDFLMPVLYNRTSFDDIAVYWRTAYLKCLMRLSADGKCIGYEKDMDRPGAWMNNPVHGARFGGVENWKKTIKGQNIDSVTDRIINTADRIEKNETKTADDEESKIRNAVERLDENLMQIIEKNPETEFLAVFPPYSRAEYAMWYQYEVSYAKYYEKSVRHLVFSGYKNLKVYGFDSVSGITDDLSLFKDPTHYHYTVNTKMLEMAGKGEGLLTPGNVDAYLAENRMRALAFSLSDLAEKLK